MKNVNDDDLLFRQDDTRGVNFLVVPDKPRADSGSGSTAVSRQPLLEWTRAKPTKLSSFRDQALLSTLADRVRQERLAAQQRKRLVHQELATAVLADGAGNQSKDGRPLSGDAAVKPDVAPMVITGLEPEDIGEALQLGHKMINNDDQNASGIAQSASRQMHAANASQLFGRKKSKTQQRY